MLTLSRKEGEALVLLIDDLEINVILREARGGTGRISVEAPEDVVVLRGGGVVSPRELRMTNYLFYMIIIPMIMSALAGKS